MPVSRPERERRASQPRVSLLPEQSGIVELSLPVSVTVETWRVASSDAAGVARLSRGPARVLIDAQRCESFAPGVLTALRAWLREVEPVAGRVAVVLAQRKQRAWVRLTVWLTRGRARTRVFASRGRAVKWLGDGAR